MKNTILTLMCLLLAAPCMSETITVALDGSGDFDNVQDAINYSWDGDIVVVGPGTYNEQIAFCGRRITLTSENPGDPNIVNSTILTASVSDTVFFNFGEDLNSVLTGFTITQTGGDTLSAILGTPGAAPTITKNMISSTTYCSIKYIGGNISNNVISDGGILTDGDCIISNNTIIGCDTGIMTYWNCVISNNTIVDCLVGICSYQGIAVVKNNIICDGTFGIDVGSQGQCQNSFNCFWGNGLGGTVPGPGDIYDAPLFVDDGNGDYHLKSEAGRWDAISETWVTDGVTSRCIDAGDPNDSIGMELSPNGGRLNMGAYGCTAEASKSTSGIVEFVCIDPPAIDFNDDCKTDFLDFAALAESWLDCGLDPPSACWE